MPLIPPPTPTVYDSVYTVLSTARTRLNDTLPTLFPVGGKLLDLSQTQTQQICNTAFRKMQEYLANMGFSRLTQEQVIYALPPVANLDPATQTYINWFNFFDGQNIYTTPVLPPNMILPKRIWERQSGTSSRFCEMGMVVDGIPSWNKQWRNLCWEWRGDAIYMPGSQMTMDLRLRYAAYLGDFLDVGDVQWFQQPVPIMRCLDSLSYYICFEVLQARGESIAAEYLEKAQNAAKLIMNRDVSLTNHVNIRRRPRSGRGDGSSWGGGLWC